MFWGSVQPSLRSCAISQAVAGPVVHSISPAAKTSTSVKHADVNESLGDHAQHFRTDRTQPQRLPASAFGGDQVSPNPTHTSFCHARSLSPCGTGIDYPAGAGSEKSFYDVIS